VLTHAAEHGGHPADEGRCIGHLRSGLLAGWLLHLSKTLCSAMICAKPTLICLEALFCQINKILDRKHFGIKLKDTQSVCNIPFQKTFELRVNAICIRSGQGSLSDSIQSFITPKHVTMTVSIPSLLEIPYDVTGRLVNSLVLYSQ
jgi:hypothetical protein